MDITLLFRIFASTVSLILFVTECRHPNKLDKSAQKSKATLDFKILYVMLLACTCSLSFNYAWFWKELIFGEEEDILHSSNALVLVGLVICVVGKYFRARAKKELGKFFTYEVGVSEEQKLIKTGLYSYIMHPSYLGISMMGLGICMIYSSIVLWVLQIIYFLGLINRIGFEEKALMAGFGKEFEEYRSKRWRLLPFIY